MDCSLQDSRVQGPLVGIDKPSRPAPWLWAPIMAEVQSCMPLILRDEGTTINGCHYETAIEVTPPGQLMPYPKIILSPQREPSIEVKLDDLYDLDVSDKSDEVAKSELESTAHLHFNGHISDFWGAWHIKGPNRAKHDNSFHLMLSSHVYYSEWSNSVFTGQSALDTSLYKRDYNLAYRPILNNQVYARAPRGIPWDPFEVNGLLILLSDQTCFTNQKHSSSWLSYITFPTKCYHYIATE